MISVPEASWKILIREYAAKVLPVTTEPRRRRAHGEQHPTEDFLFNYYPYPISLLEQWQPGLGRSLEFQDRDSLPPQLLKSRYVISENAVQLNIASIRPKEMARLDWIRNLLSKTADQTGRYSCFGLHEWAMVYRAEHVRHDDTLTLRLPQAEIDQLVEAQPLQCSHYDAFRFFAKQARPMNRTQLTLDSRELNEQPGCVHTNMDLYKWAAKSMPWIGSDLLLKTFLLARRLRELDMRASPYDLEAYGLDPVKIETVSGRREYEKLQRELATEARVLRADLIESLTGIIDFAALSPLPK